VPAANHGNLRHNASYSAIDRGDNQDVSAAVTGTPDANLLLVRLFQFTGERDCIRIVPNLQPGIDLLPRLAIARAKAAVVVNHRGKTHLDECLSILVEVHFFHCGKTMRQDDGRMWPRPIRMVMPAA